MNWIATPLAILILAPLLACPAVHRGDPPSGARAPAVARAIKPIGERCPHNDPAINDGCAGANPSSTYQEASWSADGAVLQNGQRWAVRYRGDHAGFDYPVGHYTPTATLKDPSTYNWTGTGCSYQPTAMAGGPELSCDIPTTGANAGVLNLLGFNFGATAAHRCVTVLIGNTTAGKITIKDNNFANDSDNAGTGCDRGRGGSFMIGSEGCSNGEQDMDFEFNTVDGNGRVETGGMDMLVSQGCPSGVGVFKYNAFLNAQARVIGGSSRVTFDYNYIYGMNLDINSDLHGEVYIANGQSGFFTETAIGNTIVFTKNSFDNTTAFYCSTGNALVVVTGNCDIENNLVITNVNTKRAGPVSALLFEMAYNNFRTVTVKNNDGDPSGLINNYWYAELTPPAWRQTVRGNINLLTGASFDTATTPTTKGR